MAEQTPSSADDDGLCCGDNAGKSYGPKKGEPRNLHCIKGCPNSPRYWNRDNDAELRPLGER
ncbi:hypothetical protein AB0H43_13540 [Hamadaea sp. NPDC050747]|uniref:hypothetical protein n=1 Tax=Hamadaea sp. NPDC050747 TaxID=3155789 RepID=UPI0033F23C78